MPDDLQTTKQYLLKVYELLRDQTEVVADMNMMLAPLIESLGDHPALTASFLTAQKKKIRVTAAIKRESLAVIDDVIHRLKEDLNV
jgi:hypothetical protein